MLPGCGGRFDCEGGVVFRKGFAVVERYVVWGCGVSVVVYWCRQVNCTRVPVVITRRTIARYVIGGLPMCDTNFVKGESTAETKSINIWICRKECPELSDLVNAWTHSRGLMAHDCVYSGNVWFAAAPDASHWSSCYAHGEGYAIHACNPIDADDKTNVVVSVW